MGGAAERALGIDGAGEDGDRSTTAERGLRILLGRGFAAGRWRRGGRWQAGVGNRRLERGTLQSDPELLP